MSFQIALSQVGLTLLYIMPGYLLSKTKKASAQHLSTLSAVLIYVCGPCLHISTFISMDFSWEVLRGMALFFLVTLILQGGFMAFMFFLFRSRQEDARFRILNIGSALGNVGFFGLPVIRALLPGHPEAACYSAIYCVTMNILVFTMGIFCLTKDKKYMSVKSALINPTMIGFYIAMPLFALSARQHLPATLLSSLKLIGDMSTPFCMIILGIRLSQTPIKKLFSQPFVYAVSLAKLTAYPLFCYALVYFLPLPMAFKASVLVLSATPCASIILNLAEIHHREMDLAANCVLMSTLLCIFTIPLITLLV
ncbi:MAG: AEC family transporter [Clostridia bacterium]|nr:AEC family transporter [Clostridia bacterium]